MADFISVKINDSRLIKELPRFFRDAYSYISELAQNAYRSGATRLSITATEGTVRFADNGHGIDDPAVVFTIAESAWENTDIATMDPAGMGLFAAFFASNRIKIRSIRKGKGWHAEFSRDDILSLRPIKIYHTAFPNEPDGTTVTLYGSFQPASIKCQAQWHIHYFTGMCVTFNGEEIKQEDFLESGGDIVYRKNVAAGELVLYNDTCRHRDCNNAIFHGKVIEIPQSATERLCFRLAVRENGLTPRLPDRTSFVEDNKYHQFKKDLATAAREALLAGALRISPQLAAAYLTEADRAALLPEKVADISLNGNSIYVPAHPWRYPAFHTHLTTEKTNILDYDIIIPDDWLPEGHNHTVIAALYWLHRTGKLRVGVIASDATKASLSPILHDRLRYLEDFTINTVSHGSFTDPEISEPPFRLIFCSVTLKDNKCGQQWPVEGILPAIGFTDLYGELPTYYWSLDRSPFDIPADEIYSHLYDVTTLCCHIDDERSEEDPYSGDFDYYLGRHIHPIFSPGEALHNRINRTIRDFLYERLGHGILSQGYNIINLELNNGKTTLQVETNDKILIFNERGFHQQDKIQQPYE